MVENLTVIIPFFNGHSHIDKLIESLPQELPVIIVDDHSNEHPVNKWSRDRKVTIIRPTNKGYFAGAVNAGIKACSTDVLVLNQDTWFENDLAFGLIDDRRNEGFAMVGERIRGENPSFGKTGYIHGTFMFLRRDAIQQVGPLNEKEYPLWGGTAELQLRMARKGYAVLPIREIPGFCHARPENAQFGSSISYLLDRTPRAQKSKLIQTPPLLSVIVPCYNYGRYLSDCINSLIGGPTSLGTMPGQTLQSFEVIVVNDASTDNSREYIDRVVSETKGIRAYHLEKNLGTAGALNYGIKRASGNYITFLSADDMRESDSLEKLVDACKQNPHSFAYDDVCLFTGHERIKKWRMGEYDFESLLYKNQVHAGIVFPRQAWEEVGGYPEIMRDGREDWAFNVALGVYGYCGVHVREYGYLYRREEQNRSLTNTTLKHREIFLRRIQSVFPEIYKGHRPMACCGKRGNSSRRQPTTSLQSRELRSLTLNRNGGSTQMATTTTGSEGFVRLEYLGRQMTAVWDGPATNTRYRFGSDRPVGWVDRRDVGERNKNGFLNIKDRHNNWLFQVQEDGSTQEVQKTVVGETKTEKEIGVEDAVSATIVLEKVEEELPATEETQEAEPTIDFPNPADLYPSDIKKLDLTREQWDALYRSEMANRNRKSVITFVEEKLAGE